MSLVLRGMRTNARFVLTVQTKGEIMNAKCHTCEWESLNYTHKHWAEKAAREQDVWFAIHRFATHPHAAEGGYL